MRIYVDRGGLAPSPRRLRIYLAEKGIQVPYVELEIHRENRTPEFRKKNPFQTLPVLELDDGTCISESIAICRYFEELHPDPPLFGTTALEKAETEMWLRVVEWRLYLPIDFATEDVLPPEGVPRFRKGALRAMDFLDRLLGGREFIAGRRYSIADAFALSAIDFGARFRELPILPAQENLARWHRAVSERPSARA